MSKKKSLVDALKKSRPTLQRASREPLWKGPEVDGITQSLLSEFLVCRERFRLKVIEGTGVPDSFNHRIEYGNLFHLAKEVHHAGNDWKLATKVKATKLARKYKNQQREVYKYWNLLVTQFPIYLAHWEDYEKETARESLVQEYSFKVPYLLPSGREVILRGKWDEVTLRGEGSQRGVWLEETKTKGSIDEQRLTRQLAFDLQTMFYLVALETGVGLMGVDSSVPIRGISYDVIRRPLSGGKGTIRQHKPTRSNPGGETEEEFYKRVGEYISGDPNHFFMRWEVPIGSSDIHKFKIQFLNPILEQLVDWYTWIEEAEDIWEDTYRCGIHWRLPYGIHNPIAEGGSTDFDEYLDHGNLVGLTQIETLFPELEEGE